MKEKTFEQIKADLKKEFMDRSWSMEHDYTVYGVVLDFIQKHFFKELREKKK